VKRGFQLLPFSRYSASAPSAKRLPLYASGRPVVRSMIAPSEPSSFSAAVDLVILIPPNSSEAKVLKSKPRERLAPESDWLPPAMFCASAPFSRTIWKSPPRPRTVIVRPSPLSRSIDTPGRRWIDSARLASGNSAMSSAVIASTIWFELRLMFSEFCSEARKPVTTISSFWGGASILSGGGLHLGWGRGVLCEGGAAPSSRQRERCKGRAGAQDRGGGVLGHLFPSRWRGAAIPSGRPPQIRRRGGAAFAAIAGVCGRSSRRCMTRGLLPLLVSRGLCDRRSRIVIDTGSIKVARTPCSSNRKNVD
jgi:hypothetical protein